MERYCRSQLPGIAGMKYHRVCVLRSSVAIDRFAQAPDVLFTVAVHVTTLGMVHVVNLQREP